MSHDPHDMSGQVIASQFKVQRLLGRGGMGVVYLAEQLNMERLVVIKLLHSALTQAHTETTARFKREAKAIARLNHPNIVQVHVFGELPETQQLYLVMEHIRGATLGQALSEREPIPAPRALRIVDQICSALTEAHGAGIIHRDLKPDNIMLTERHGQRDYVKILDFGIARMHSDEGLETKAGDLFGTPRYMAPEQAQASAVDARADLYSLGVMLYEMLVGRHPFEAETAIEYLVKHQTQPIPPPRTLRPDLRLPPRVEALTLRLLAKAPGERFQSAAELQREVRLALRDFPDAARLWPTPGEGVSPPPSAPRRRRWPLRLALLILLALVGAAGALVYHPTLSRDLDLPPELRALIARLAPDTDEVRAPDAGGVVRVSRAVGAVAIDAGAPFTPPDAAPPAPEPHDASPPLIDAAPPAPDAAPAAPPEPALKAGPDVEGYPAPVGARVMLSSPQLVSIVTSASPREARAFYQYQLHARGVRAVKPIAAGLQIGDESQPFNGVWFNATALGTSVTLTRNPFHEQTSTSMKAPEEAFGVPLPEGLKISSRTPQNLIGELRAPFRRVSEPFARRFGGVEGMMMVRSEPGAPASLILSAAQIKSLEWMAIIIQEAPGQPGVTRVIIQGRD